MWSETGAGGGSKSSGASGSSGKGAGGGSTSGKGSTGGSKAPSRGKLEVKGARDSVAKSLKETLGRELNEGEVNDMLGVENAVDADISYTVSEHEGGVRLEAITAGREVEVVRDFKKVDGKLVVKHEALFIDEEVKGQGIGSKIVQHQVELYQQMGADRIETEATRDGQYVWPRMGFELANPDDLDDIKSEFRSYLEDDAGLDSDDADKLVGRVKSLHGLATSKLRGEDLDEDEANVGKNFLLQRGQHADPLNLVLPLQKGSQGLKRFETYHAKRKKKAASRGDAKKGKKVDVAADILLSDEVPSPADAPTLDVK